ncbi:MAG: hypothetical protein ACMG6E_04170 [Candidatus Roizmanbacteria bacterium]
MTKQHILYQEHPKDRWEHNGTLYDLNKIFEIVQDKEIISVPLTELYDQYRNSKKEIDGHLTCGSCFGQTKDFIKAKEVHQERVQNTDLSIPLILYKDGKKWRVVDGVHRLEKAILSQKESLPARVISSSELEKTKA